MLLTCPRIRRRGMTQISNCDVFVSYIHSILCLYLFHCVFSFLHFASEYFRSMLDVYRRSLSNDIIDNKKRKLCPNDEKRPGNNYYLLNEKKKVIMVISSNNYQPYSMYIHDSANDAALSFLATGSYYQ